MWPGRDERSDNQRLSVRAGSLRNHRAGRGCQDQDQNHKDGRHYWLRQQLRDPVHFLRYALLREVMKQTGKVGLGKVVLRDREDLVALFPYENGLVLQKLHYPHEIRSIQEVPELDGAQKLDKNELKLATTLVEQMS